MKYLGSSLLRKVLKKKEKSLNSFIRLILKITKKNKYNKNYLKLNVFSNSSFFHGKRNKKKEK